MSDTSSSPNLTVVEPAPEVDEATPQRAAPSRLRSLLTVLLLVAAIAFCWLWLSEVEHARALDARVSSLTSELADARADIAAWERTMDAVRGEVGRVAEAFASLQALVEARTPARPPAPGAAAAPAAAAAPGTEPSAP